MPKTSSVSVVVFVGVVGDGVVVGVVSVVGFEVREPKTKVR